MDTALYIFLVINTILFAAILFYIRNKEKYGVSENLAEKILKSIREDFALNRNEYNKNFKESREELGHSMKFLSESFLKTYLEHAKSQNESLTALTQSNEQKFDALKDKVDQKLKELQANNEKKLDEIRSTVDEKLHSTLEKRLGESFKLVSERLELVHKGLGEMQNLAVGVGDLKKVLSNIKTRGIWGEYQAENIIEQILTPDQYEKNAATKKNSSFKVEFAVKFPGRGGSNDFIYLPIDAKFPLEIYQRLLQAQEIGSSDEVESASKVLFNKVINDAKDISEKYIDPPNTTDFAIMFLPIEGLYAEVLRFPGIAEKLQREFRVAIAGPTTFAAMLNSLQMGFRTLAIEKRASEVWKLLGAVKTDFENFGDLLDKTHKKLQEASNTIENAAKKSRTIEKKLKDVQSLPKSEEIKSLDEAPD